jgi:hypothetical protein
VVHQPELLGPVATGLIRGANAPSKVIKIVIISKILL